MLMPLAFPAYVLAFIYLGAMGPSTHWSEYVELQGSLGFLIFVLSLALTPYVYYFSLLGLKSVSQSEWERELYSTCVPDHLKTLVCNVNETTKLLESCQAKKQQEMTCMS